MSRSLVSAAWLAKHIRSPNLRVLDATFHMPAWNRDAKAEFQQQRIPTAGFFDIDAIAKQDTNLPHMLPTEEQFEQAMHELGVGQDTHVIAYDCSDFGVFSAPRLWWTLRTFGHDNVSVLNGGLLAWKAQGYDLETDSPVIPATPAKPFQARLRRELVRRYDQVRDNITVQEATLLDARSTGRFEGIDPEPRADLPSGHVPNSVSLPFTELLDAKAKTMLTEAQLQQVFASKQIDLTKPAIASCGSGITACVIALAAYNASQGKAELPVYDGSWAEYASRPDSSVIMRAQVHNVAQIPTQPANRP
eukprot:TRINITY_DN10493_c1_g1_i2.p1 TRINITY_DN10493_c1_g1~~TRINITY_DN10493_c1_g1_i2.p1  ORF type:complete len:305 (+),score=75.21 TRINITY_DN10493_c1_g1_i2:126-1040(+)